MDPVGNPIQRLQALFAQEPCWLIETLAGELQYSIPSVRRFLVSAGYFTSFTHNGKWYTLKHIPQFNRDGLWFSGDVGFSRAGNLTATLIHWISRSPAGMTAEELGQKLRCRCHSILVNLFRRSKLNRDRFGRAYVYLAPDLSTAECQRKALTQHAVAPTPVPAEIAVLIFAEFIRHPDSSAEQLAAVLKRSSRVHLSPPQVERLFEEHGLKKTT